MDMIAMLRREDVVELSGVLATLPGRLLLTQFDAYLEQLKQK